MVKKGFRERFLVPVQSRIRPTSPSGSPNPPATTTASTVVPTSSSSTTPTSITASSRTATSPSQRVLQAALQRLSDQDRGLIEKYILVTSSDANVALDQVIRAAQAQQQQYRDTHQRWTFTFGSRTVVLREEADKVVRWLKRFQAVGDIVANVDPVHIGLPWAGIRLLLEVAVGNADQRAALLVGCELALYMSNRLKVYLEFLCRLTQSQAQANFEDALVQLHAYILGFLSQAIRTYQTSAAHRTISGFWSNSEITDFESRCDLLAARLEVEASNCDRELYQKYTQQALEDIRKLYCVQQSLDRIEAKIDLDKLNRLRYVASAEFNAYEADYETCCPGTRTEVLRLIMDWAQQTDGKRIFWLNGMAGTGKSTISYTIAQQLHDGTKSISAARLGATFFFKRGETERNSTKRLFPTIARRLAYQLPALAPLLVEAVSAEPDICEKKPGEQFEKLVYCPLEAFSASMDDDDDLLILIVIVDALDECDKYEDIQTLLKLWPRLGQLTRIQLKLFLTGRPASSVLQGMDAMPVDVRKQMALHDVPQTEIRGDITLYLRDQLSRTQNTGISTAIDTWPSDGDLQALLNLTVPLFIAAATACRFIKGDSRWDPRARLQTLLTAHGTHQLSRIEELYRTVLMQLTSTCMEPNDLETVYTEFRIIVGSIILLANPLSPKSLSKLLQVDLDSFQRCLNTLHSVLYVPSDPNMTVRTLHLSFREFLLSTKSPDLYRINGPDSHHTLLTRCLDLLRGPEGLKENICGIAFPGQLRQDIRSSTIEKCLAAETQYACLNWTYHAQRCGRQIVDGDAIHAFFQDHFLHWLEALSLIGSLSTAIGALRDLMLITSDNSETLAFLKDAHRFTLANRHLVNLAPLQLYSSAIVFSPQNSLVRNICGQTPVWIRQTPIVPSSWSSELQKLEGHTDWVLDVAFSADGTQLASVSDDVVIRLWNASTGQEIQMLKRPFGTLNATAFSSDGKLVVSALSDDTIRLYDVTTGQEVNVLKGHNDVISAIACLSNGKLIASASHDRIIKLWDSSTGQQLQNLEGHTDRINRIMFSPNGKLLVSASDDTTIRLWDVNTGQQTRTIEGHRGRVKTVAVSPDGSFIASAADDLTIRLWDLDTGQQSWTIDAPSDRGNTIAFSPDSKLIAVSNDLTIGLWDLSTKQKMQPLEGHTSLITAVAFSPVDNKLMISASYDRTVRLWDLSIQQDIPEYKRHTEEVTSIAFSPNGQLLVSASIDGIIRLWNVSRGQQIQEIQGHARAISEVAFSPGDGKLVVSASWDRTMRLWDVETGQQVQQFIGHTDVVGSVAYSSDGKLVISASWDETIRLWDVSTGQQMQEFRAPDQSAIVADLSPNQELVVSTSLDCAIRLWKRKTECEPQILRGHTGSLWAVAFSPDGKLLASASIDETIRLWDVATRREVQQFSHFSRTVKFSADGRTLLTDQDSLDINPKLMSSALVHQSSRLDIDSKLVLPAATQQSFRRPISISSNYEWIQWHGQNLLWLPHEYRTQDTTWYDNVIAFAPYGGGVRFLELDYSITHQHE